MKITGQPYYGEPNASVRKQRLETVLPAWRFPRLLYAAERAVPPPSTALAVGELVLWLEILRTGQPVPPRYHLEGLRTYARLHGLSVNDLEHAKTILIVGDQVAAHGNIPRLGYVGLHWSLLVGAQVEGKPAEAVLRKRFQNVEVHGDELIAWGAWENCTDSIGPLARDALSATPDELARIWKIALALNIEYRFLSALPEGPAKALAELLRKELDTATPVLTVATDARLLRFAAAGEDSSPVPRELQLPESRLTALLEVDSFFERARHYYSQWYFDCVARAFARVAHPFTLGDALLKLGPGSALNTALHEIVTERPEVIAIYANHPAYSAEGAFMLLQLQQRTVFGHRSTPLDFNDEWTEVQQLTRELLLLGDQTNDWNSLVALGIHDELEALRPRHYGTAGIDRGKAQYDGSALWARAVADHDRSPHFVKVLEEHFRARERHSDAAIVFALRLLRPLRDSGQAALATRLATAIVEGYASMLRLDAGILAVPSVFPAYGELFAGLHDSLDLGGETWRKFLRPFDTAAYLERARAEQGQSVTSGWSANFLVPQILRTHAGTLVALAASLAQFEEPLQVAIELYEADRKAGLYVPAFSWTGLARVTSLGAHAVGEQLFVTIGRLLPRVAGHPPWLMDFLNAESEPHILASIAAGIDPSHPIAETIRPRLRGLVNELLASSGGVALGHTMELAKLMEQAGIPRDAERLARRALQILEQLPQGARSHFALAAEAQLAGALAQQNLWPEVLSIDAPGNLVVTSPPARFIENMRALALTEAGRYREAEVLLQMVLEAEPSNAVALVNMTAVLVRAGRYEDALKACEHAQPLLQEDDAEKVLGNELEAYKQLKRSHPPRLLSAAAKKAAAGARVGPAKADVREKIPAAPQEDIGPDDGSRPPTDRTVSEKLIKVVEPPDPGIDIAIVTALPEEHEAVMALLDNVRDPPQVASPFPNLFVWKLGEIRNHDGTGTFKVVLAQAQRAGNMDSMIAAVRTIDRWNPRFLLFSGIAGGISLEGLTQGDIVLSEDIWFYENGKMAKKYRPRDRNFQPDLGLLNSARGFGRNTGGWKVCKATPPVPAHVPKCLAGLIGSGDKVLDSLKPALVKQILRARPKIQAVEMEAAGAGAAIQNAQQEGRAVGFMMVRGISDMPESGTSASGAGTEQRDDWKPYASAIAACFVVSWISSSAWPYPPRSSAS